MRDQPTAEPRFSVVIPTYRRNDSLALCLERLADGAQTLPAREYEVIVADDAPDGENARRMVEERFPSVRWVAGPGKGPAANRNRGAAEARGAWLAFTDDDCLPQPGWLAGYAARIDAADGAALRVLEGPTTAGDAGRIEPFFTAPLNDVGGLLWSCNFAIEHRFFDEIGRFDDGFPFPHLEDVDLRLRLEDRGQAYPFVPEAVVAHPPRPVGSVFKWVESQESAFYLARKRRVPVGQYGQSFMSYLRILFHSLRACRTMKQRVLVGGRLITGMVLIACRRPFWQAKYRQGIPTPSKGQ